MHRIARNTDPHTLSSELLFRSYQNLYLPNRAINDVFQVGPGWLLLLGEFLAKAAWLQGIVRLHNPQFQVIVRSFVSDHGKLKVSYGSSNAGFMEDSALADMVFSLEQRATLICENTGGYGELCQHRGLLRTLSFEEAQKTSFTPCSPLVAEQWKRRVRRVT